ncbi:hypothetical protein EG850_12740 [Gulosibacter macacae]|uniref:Uncharacterized protein n=1 Tax=Gulosibacter macacae TaxID=2488791 RepID=A0A3P3VY31_9MICO|nr:hypothetical protein [Gulosibacter macacae]RRJ85583.1 hypothetical protein EG850_12740 [Gulosibacter macacae]
MKLQKPPGSQDGMVTAVGIGVADLLDRSTPGNGSITVPSGSHRVPRVRRVGRGAQAGTRLTPLRRDEGR